MHTVTLLATGLDLLRSPRRAHPKAYLESEDGTRLYLSWAPREATLDGLTGDWTRLDRPGRRPLTARGGLGLPTHSSTFTLGHINSNTSIEPEITTLRKLASSGARVRFAHGGLEVGWWRIESLQIESLARQEGTNAVTRASCSVGLVQDNPAPVRIGATSTTNASLPPAGAGWRTYTWKRGDRIFNVARRLLGDGRRWREITLVNGITRPAKIKVGTVLRIPPR